MIVNRGNSLLETKRINRILIKKIIFQNNNITRIEIANMLKLTLPTITTSIQEMINEEILEDVRINFPKKLALGRKPSFIAFKSDVVYSVGVELGPYYTAIAVIDMKGNVIQEKYFDKPNKNYEKMLEELSENILKTLPRNKKILGIGIGVAGCIEGETGTIRNNREKSWNGKSLAADIEKRIHYPVYIDNNVKLRALGYNLSIKNSKMSTFAYLFMSKGVACPLVIENEILSGFTSGAGEIGQNIIYISQQNKKVDELASEVAILRHCNALIEKKELIVKGEMITNEIFTIWEVIHLQECGCKEIDAIVEEAINYMVIAVSHVVNLINPGILVVDSAIFIRNQNKEIFMQKAREYFFDLNENEVKIEFTDFNKNRGAVGAAYYIIKKLLLESDGFHAFEVVDCK